MTDWQLLRKFMDGNSQAAFAELCRRYTNLVYRVCQRELGETGLAEDAAQAVFLLLARKAPSLKQSRADVSLASWLFQAALLTAKNARRQEQRRQAHELEAAQMQTQRSAISPEWAEVEPLLNDALQALPTGQRTIILERFFQERPLAEIGAGQGISEDAARMRVNRALDRLRRWFAARNVALSAAALAALLPLSVRPAPAHAAEAVARLTLPTIGDNTPAQTLAQGVLDTMNLNRLKLQLGAAALVAVFVLGTAGAVRVTTQMKARRVAAARLENQAQALAVLNQMYTTYAAMHSFRCHDIIRQDNLGVTSDALYEIQRPANVRFDRVSLFDPGKVVQADTVDLSGQTLAVSDGSSLYVTFTPNHKQANQYARIRLSDAITNSTNLGDWGSLTANGGEAYAGMPSVAVGLKLRPSVNLSAPEYSLGQPNSVTFPGSTHPVILDVVTAKMNYNALQSTNSGAGEIVTYYIGQQDHLLYQVVATDFVTQTNFNTMTERINNMEVNLELKASDFVFTPPSGSHEVPNTRDLFPGSGG